MSPKLQNEMHVRKDIEKMSQRCPPMRKCKNKCLIDVFATVFVLVCEWFWRCALQHENNISSFSVLHVFWKRSGDIFGTSLGHLFDIFFLRCVNFMSQCTSWFPITCLRVVHSITFLHIGGGADVHWPFPPPWGEYTDPHRPDGCASQAAAMDVHHSLTMQCNTPLGHRSKDNAIAIVRLDWGGFEGHECGLNPVQMAILYARYRDDGPVLDLELSCIQQRPICTQLPPTCILMRFRSPADCESRWPLHMFVAPTPILRPRGLSYEPNSIVEQFVLKQSRKSYLDSALHGNYSLLHDPARTHFHNCPLQMSQTWCNSKVSLFLFLFFCHSITSRCSAMSGMEGPLDPEKCSDDAAKDVYE